MVVKGRGRSLLAALAVLLFIGIFGLRLLEGNPNEVILILFVIPIILIAFEAGIRGGTLAAGVSLILVVLWAETHGAEIGMVGYISRGVAFTGAGVTTGYLAQRLRSLEEESARWFDLSLDLACTAGFDGHFKRVNPTFERILGFATPELLSRPFLEFVHPDDRARTEAETAKLATAGSDTIDFQNRYRTEDGSYRWLEWKAKAVASEQLIYAAARDITDRRQAEEARREAEERFKTAFERAPIGMALVDLEGHWLQVNDALCRLTGYPRWELLQKGFQESSHPDDLKRDVEGAARLRKGETESYRMEKRFINAEGEPVWVSFNASLVRIDDGQPLHLITQVEDINERKKLEAELEYLAQHDPLTGLFNRRRFEQELVRQLEYARRYGTRSALMMMDLDGFKAINDTYGHKAGDEVLLGVAATLRAALRSTDVVARLGGDEFAIILPESTGAAAARAAEKLLGVLRMRPFSFDNDARAQISMGIALVHGGSDWTSEQALVAADRALYNAKKFRRHGISFYDSALENEL